MAKVQLEMGGKNPLVVLDDADLGTAVELRGAGRVLLDRPALHGVEPRSSCTEGIHDRFVAAMIERLKALKVDDALKAGTEIGPVVDQQQLEQDLRLHRDRPQARARRSPSAASGSSARPTGYYLAPALFTDTTQRRCASTARRSSGRSPRVIRVKDYDEALAVANDTPFGLSSGIVHHLAQARRRTSSATPRPAW